MIMPSPSLVTTSVLMVDVFRAGTTDPPRETPLA